MKLVTEKQYALLETLGILFRNSNHENDAAYFNFLRGYWYAIKEDTEKLSAMSEIASRIKIGDKVYKLVEENVRKRW